MTYNLIIKVKNKSNYQNILQHYGQSKLFYHIFATPGNCICIISVIITQIYSVCPASGRANGVKSAQNAAFIFVRPAALLQLTQDLFNRNALGKVAGFIHIQAFGAADIVCQQLQRHHRKAGGKVRVCFGHIYGKVGGIFNAVVAVSGQAHDISAAALGFHQVRYHLLVQVRLGQHTHHQHVLLDQGDRAVLHLARSESLRVDIADFLELQAAFQRHGVIQPAADEESVLCGSILGSKPLDALIIRQRLGDLIRQDLQLGHQLGVFFFLNLAAHTGKFDRQQVAGCQLGAVCLGGGNGNFRPGPGIQGCIGLTRNGRAHHVHNADGAHAALLTFAQGSQGIGGFAALADNDRHGIRLQHGVTVAELAGHIHLHRQAGQAFKHIACRNAHMVGGAAANDIDAAHIFDGFFIQAQLAQINAAILDAGAEGIPHSGGLFVDLLHHKVLVTAFFGGFGVPLDGAGFFFNRFFINVEKLNNALDTS